MKKLRKNKKERNEHLHQNAKFHIPSLTTHHSGITLIALVVTIVVLLILAAITITMVFGDNGILKTAQDSATEHRAGTVEDEVTVWKSGKLLSQYDKNEVQSREELIEDQKVRGLLTEEEAETAKETGSVKIGSKTIDYGNKETVKFSFRINDENRGLWHC